MGSQCSTVTLQKNFRSSFLSSMVNSSPVKIVQFQNVALKADFQIKLDYVRNIQNQKIQQNSKEISSFQKYKENRCVVKFVNGSQYKGYVNDEGKRDKQGQQTWPDSTKYIGGWKNNLPHGNGILASPHGFTFQGCWSQGSVEGFGKYYGKNGCYQGQWKYNCPHGQGIQTWNDGSKYEGDFRNGKKHGKGTYIWSDMSTYDGQWSEGEINGEGVYQYVDGRIYRGSFKNNKMHGQGTYEWPDGRKYVGSYENDQKEGIGKYYWPDGRYFQGEWREGKRNGYGKVVLKNGLIKYGLWENDQKIEQRSNFGQIHRQNDQKGIDSTAMNSIAKKESKNPNSQKNRSQIFSSINDQTTNSALSKSKRPNSKTQKIPLYASSISPYKQLRNYYEQYSNEETNQKIMNRYKFINSPLKKCNVDQSNSYKSHIYANER